MTKRPYRQSRRAEQQAQTRARILEATMALHQDPGPLYTTISAVAERAGVQRLTVYRHFPDETALFRACTAGWLERNPPPDPSRVATGPRRDRGRCGLEALYAYYAGTHRMWHAAYRDRDQVPALQEPMAAFEAYLDAYGAALLGTWPGADEPALALRRTTLALALRFPSWEVLEAEALDDREKAALVETWLRALR